MVPKKLAALLFVPALSLPYFAGSSALGQEVPDTSTPTPTPTATPQQKIDDSEFYTRLGHKLDDGSCQFDPIQFAASVSDGPQFQPPPDAFLTSPGKVIEAREVSADPASCTEVLEVGFPASPSADTGETGAVATPTVEGSVTATPAQTQTVEGSAASNTAPHADSPSWKEYYTRQRSWYEDILTVDLAKDRLAMYFDTNSVCIKDQAAFLYPTGDSSTGWEHDASWDDWDWVVWQNSLCVGSGSLPLESNEGKATVNSSHFQNALFPACSSPVVVDFTNLYVDVVPVGSAGYQGSHYTNAADVCAYPFSALSYHQDFLLECQKHC